MYTMANKGKNKRRQLEVYDEIHNQNLSVDSQEEIDFINWCSDAVNLSVINDFQYQPDSFRLFESVQYKDIYGKQRSLFRDHQYSPDFILTYDPNKYLELTKEFKVDYSQLSATEVSTYIDVKGTFNRNARSFGTDRKWLWQKFGVFICEVIPQKFFEKFGVPDKSRLTQKTKKPRSCFAAFKSIIDIFKS